MHKRLGVDDAASSRGILREKDMSDGRHDLAEEVLGVYKSVGNL